jgi:hypothetical protein
MYVGEAVLVVVVVFHVRVLQQYEGFIRVGHGDVRDDASSSC